MRVTDHAVAQATMRSPDLREKMRRHGRIAVLLEIRGEVQAALVNGRRSVSQPRWLLFHDGRRGKRGKAVNGSRYVWNETESRAYVIARDEGVWYVKTALARATRA